jgi:Ankyrin repeats (many copies)
MAKRGDATAAAWLLDHGADPNARWSHGGDDVTPLHLAAAWGHGDVVRLLLGHDADTTIRDPMHDSDPAGWADFFGQPGVAQTLRAMEAIRRRDWDRLEPLLHPDVHFDGIRGRANVLAHLREHGPARRTPSSCATGRSTVGARDGSARRVTKLAAPGVGVRGMGGQSSASSASIWPWMSVPIGAALGGCDGTAGTPAVVPTAASGRV